MVFFLCKYARTRCTNVISFSILLSSCGRLPQPRIKAGYKTHTFTQARVRDTESRVPP